jgi:hypothetical protein
MRPVRGALQRQQNFRAAGSAIEAAGIQNHFTTADERKIAPYDDTNCVWLIIHPAQRRCHPVSMKLKKQERYFYGQGLYCVSTFQPHGRPAFAIHPIGQPIEYGSLSRICPSTAIPRKANLRLPIQGWRIKSFLARKGSYRYGHPFRTFCIRTWHL